jgi:hypothetical protein
LIVLHESKSGKFPLNITSSIKNNVVLAITQKLEESRLKFMYMYIKAALAYY